MELLDGRSLDELLEDPEVDENQKTKLKQVGEIKQFAINQIGLDNSENYT